eukprot:scaffold115184_cov31-Tisochrysis_lutea.AAC.1
MTLISGQSPKTRDGGAARMGGRSTIPQSSSAGATRSQSTHTRTWRRYYSDRASASVPNLVPCLYEPAPIPLRGVSTRSAL